MVKTQNNYLLSPRSTGHVIEIWRASLSGDDWSIYSHPCNNTAIEYGDMHLLALPGTSKVLLVFREENSSGH